MDTRIYILISVTSSESIAGLVTGSVVGGLLFVVVLSTVAIITILVLLSRSNKGMFLFECA